MNTMTEKILKHVKDADEYISFLEKENARLRKEVDKLKSDRNGRIKSL